MFIRFFNGELHTRNFASKANGRVISAKTFYIPDAHDGFARCAHPSACALSGRFKKRKAEGRGAGNAQRAATTPATRRACTVVAVSLPGQLPSSDFIR